MKRAAAIFAMSLGMLAPAAHAAVTFEYLFSDVVVHDVSDDGNVVVGPQLRHRQFVPGRTPPAWWTSGVRWSSARLGVVAVPRMVRASRPPSEASTVPDTHTGPMVPGHGMAGDVPPLILRREHRWLYGVPTAFPETARPWSALLARGLWQSRACPVSSATGPWDSGGMLTGQSGRANGINHNGTVIEAGSRPAGPVASRRVG